jgi:hypothetical protein
MEAFIMAEMGVIPYSFNGITEYPRSQPLPTIPGQAQGVYITLHPDIVDNISMKIAGWFAGREEIEIVDVGISDKQGLGFLIIEWLECEIDQLFLAILRDEELVGDYTVYGRDLEV